LHRQHALDGLFGGIFYGKLVPTLRGMVELDDLEHVNDTRPPSTQRLKKDYRAAFELD
jgi:hypothetical protein